MKFNNWIAFVVIIFLAACQSATPVATFSPQQTTAPYPPPQATPLPNAGPYPAPTESTGGSVYPAPAVTEDMGGSVYPAPGSSEVKTVSWDEAKSIILNGEVAEVFQLHSLEVKLTLKDGSKLSTTEPAIDDVFKVIEECGEKCADIKVATE
jgi:hypothetical protein